MAEEVEEGDRQACKIRIEPCGRTRGPGEECLDCHAGRLYFPLPNLERKFVFQVVTETGCNSASVSPPTVSGHWHVQPERLWQAEGLWDLNDPMLESLGVSETVAGL